MSDFLQHINAAVLAEWQRIIYQLSADKGCNLEDLPERWMIETRERESQGTPYNLMMMMN